MEKLKSKSPYIFIAMASISFIAFYFTKKIRRLMMSEGKKVKMIQEAIEEVRREQEKKQSDEILNIIKSERDKQTMAFSKYGHRHR